MSLADRLTKGDGPIPGENFTSDTKNYAWHRPPETNNTDEAIDAVLKIMKKPGTSYAMMEMLELGLTVSDITSMLIMKGVSKGKWTVDVGLLISGPIAHMIVILAKINKTEYDLGLNDEFTGKTSEFFKKTVGSKKGKGADKELDEVSEKAKESLGFMGGDIPSMPEADPGPIVDPMTEEMGA